MIATDLWFVGIWPATPGVRWRGDHRAAICFVFQAFQHHRGDVQLGLMFRPNSRKSFHIGMPAPNILCPRSLKVFHQRSLAVVCCFDGITAEAEDERESRCGMIRK